MEITWRASTSASCFHAASALLANREIADGAAAQAIATPLEELKAYIVADEVPPQTFLSHLVPLAGTVESNRDLAETALRKTIGYGKAEHLVSRYRNLITELEHCFEAAVTARIDPAGHPLKTRFMHSADTALAALGELTEPTMLAPSATVVLIHPLGAGSGKAHPLYNIVYLETLEDSQDGPAETLHLLWLLAHLNFELPMYAEDLRIRHFEGLAALAIVPPVLAAGEAAGWGKFSVEAIDTAVADWFAAENYIGYGESLMDWWQAYASNRPRWTTAMQALAKMLEWE